jgi:ribosomal protein L10
VDRAEKREMVSTLNDVFASAGVVVVAHYGGLSVAKMTDLRAKMREAGGNGVKALATMPSLDELRAKIVGMIQTPATRIAQVVNAPAGGLARVVQAYADKGEAA